jgi:hypothetical protein
MEKVGLRGSILSGANLSGANLIRSNLVEANLTKANLTSTNLSEADLRGANLKYASLSGTNLTKANLRDADLKNASLQGANLIYASLRDSNLTGAKLPPPPMLLLARWGQVDRWLTTELMRYDAANHPDPEAFDKWALTGECPYENCNWERSAHFYEKSKLWESGPSKSALELARALLLNCTKTKL